MSWLTERQILLIGKKLGAFNIVQVSSVMRRQKVTEPDGEIVDIIDYYPPWNRQRTYGTEKVCHEYLDHQWQIDRFLKWSGVEPETIPLYESETALRRKPDRDHPKNIEVRPFKLMIIPQPAKEESQIAGKNLIDSFIVDNIAVKAWHEKNANDSKNSRPSPSPAVSQQQQAQTAVPQHNHPQPPPPTQPQVVQEPPPTTTVPQPPSPSTLPPMPQEPPPSVDTPAARAKAPQVANLGDGDNGDNDHWQTQALSATTTGDVYGFDYAIAKFLGSDEPIVRNMREKLFGVDYDPALNTAYMDGLSAYLTLRRSGVAHPEAKERATVAFKQAGGGAA